MSKLFVGAFAFAERHTQNKTFAERTQYNTFAERDIEYNSDVCCMSLSANMSFAQYMFLKNL